MTNNLPANGIVIVDDNPNNLRVLSNILQQVGYKVRPALNGQIALHSIHANPPDLILLDIRMPGMDGYEVCRQLKQNEQTRDIPIIFISALQNTEDKLAAFQAGGVDYVSKPFQMEEVLARVHSHIKLRYLQCDLQNMVTERTQELRTTLEALRSSQAKYSSILEQTIQAIALTIEKRDPYTAGHQLRVAQIAVALSQQLGLDDERINGLRLSAIVHDVGKIYIPIEILNRPGRLSDIEFSLVKTHPQVGHDIVRNVQFPWPVAVMIVQHHERMDGSGYPAGLKGDEIIFEARILAVADLIEAMSSHRPYRPALGLDRALTEVRHGAGVIYDKDVVDACVQLFADGYQLPTNNALA